MSDDGKPWSAIKNPGFFAIGLVFTLLALGLLVSGNSSWVAFCALGPTFLALSFSLPMDGDEQDDAKEDSEA
ncbi:hypothetical protein [Desertivibrio insolitus]|uniref:hypothetical protein n=1 Tax=Herbiconiux sp. SYSU D00978 TaxID=2812562 RepID=UPI001A95AFE6|nr:hypothetical protein [Herbiconiux sp. SYSU D00978]